MNFEFEMPTMRILSTSPDLREATVEFSGLAETMGHTLGNGLRRTLLSSIPGIAPVAYTILGTEKEFTDVPGLIDNTTELALKIKNLKVAASVNDHNPNLDTIPKYLILSLNRKYNNEVIKFGDFQLEDSDINSGVTVSILNPEDELTYVGKERTISMRLLLWLGTGYASYDEITKGYNVEIIKYLGDNAIFLDSDFSPIDRVVYKVAEDNPSKGVETLTLTVTTNGFLPAITAISQASGILSATFYMLQGLTNIILKPYTVSTEAKQLDIKSDRPSDMNSATPIDKLGLEMGLFNTMKQAGINNMGDLSEHTDPTGEIRRELNSAILNVRPELILESHSFLLQQSKIETVEDLIQGDILPEQKKEMIRNLESMGLKIH